jgi:hypothetical protein
MTAPGESLDGSGLVTSARTIDAVLDQHRSALGHDFAAYRNHVFRVFNLCLAVARCTSRDEVEKIAVAAVFHDLGIWTDHTFDYIAPSVALALEYLTATSRQDWMSEIESMIVNHHKITRADPGERQLVEPFRRADWIDVSRGFRRFGVDRRFIASVFARWPTHGFHWRLVGFTVERFRRHPLTPLPMVKL